MKQTTLKISLIFTVAWAGAGGACYQTKETPEIRRNAAKYVLPVCKIEEKNENKKCRFDITCRFSTGYVMMDYRLEPPATFTFDGQPFDDKLALNAVCDYKTSAFVLTDAAGNVRRDEINLNKMESAESAIVIDRRSDLVIQLKNVAYPQDTEFRLVFADKSGVEEQKLEFFSVPTDAKNANNLSEYDWKNLTLKIPAALLEDIPGDLSKIFLEATVKLQKTNPGGAERFSALTYVYQTKPVAVRWLKS